MLPEAVGVSIFELLSQLDQFQFERGKSIGGRIRHIGMVHGRIGEPLPLRLDDPGRHPDHRRIGGNRLQDDGIRADFHVVADRNPAEDLRPRSLSGATSEPFCVTWLPSVGWRLPRSFPVPPSVTP